ncbi:MAG: M20/M25/M40 family metallo-hydrolase [Chlamydiota bacterium]
MQLFFSMLVTLFLINHSLIGAAEKSDLINTKNQLTDILAHLITLDTVSSNQKANKQALNWVEQELKDYPIHLKWVEQNNYPSLLITTQETKTPKLWLIAHMDVVSAPKKLFIPVVENNKMKGRGAMDMKMAIASYILLIKELNKALPTYDFGIMLTSDEEIGGGNGIKYLLDEGYSSEIGFAPDGGFDWHIEEEAKGVLLIKLVAQGTSAHSSRPWEGDNAIEKLQEILPKIQNLFPKNNHPDINWYPTVSVTVIQGGQATNVVPDYAETDINIRFPAYMSSSKILKDINDIVQHYPGVNMMESLKGSPHKVDVKNPEFLLFKQIAKERFSIDVKTMKSHGASDARFFGEKGIPVLVISPIGGGIHSNNEWVDLNDLARFYLVMKEWVKDISSVKQESKKNEY